MPKSASELAEAVAETALDMSNDPEHGYTPGGWGPDYDCGTFVQYCYLQNDINLNGFQATGGGDQFNDGDELVHYWEPYFNSIGFELMPFDIFDLLPGDILVNHEGGHTEMVLDEHQSIGAHQDKDGQPHDYEPIDGYDEVGPVGMRGSAYWAWCFRYTD